MRNEIVVVKRRERESERKGKIMKKKGKRTRGKKKKVGQSKLKE